MLGNITFTVSSIKERTVKNAPAIVFPYFKKETEMTSIAFKLDEAMMPTQAQRDSAMMVINTDYYSKAKYILLRNFKLLPDSVISIYNDDGMKVSGAFNAEKQLCFELAIPLKHLGGNELDKISFNIRLNGLSSKNIYYPPASTGIVSVIAMPRGSSSLGSGSDQEMIYPTDHWAEYQLHK